MVLVACEKSQVIVRAFRRASIEAFSCDLKPADYRQEWHIQGDAIEALRSRKWGLVIAHPPCTRMAQSGVRWLHERELVEELDAAVAFFLKFKAYGLEGNRICIENPVPHSFARKRMGMYHQVIHPWMFGHRQDKGTCLWLYGVPPLKATRIVESKGSRVHKVGPYADRADIRSKTFWGVAKAMALQWGPLITSSQASGSE